jgi:carboxymethylenebutenolidase
MGEIITITHDKPIEVYIARPEGEIKGGVIVIHEVWGLDEHIKTVADRVAKEGFIALAPDLLGDTLDIEQIRTLQADLFDAEKRNAIQPELRRLMAPMHNPEFGEKTTSRLKKCFTHLIEMPETKGNVFVMGFCFGGTYSYNLAIVEPKLKAAAAFYGHSEQDVETLKKIKCPIQAFFGENDERLITALPDLQQRMKEASVNFNSKVYENCGHAFFNDSNKIAYNREAAVDAWNVTLRMFNENLG